MNKLLVGLLIVAAGAGVFFFLRKKEKTKATSINKEWIIGKWKLNPTDNADSNFQAFQYDFQKEGRLIQSLNDSASADTMHYEWSKADKLQWKENKEDSASFEFSVMRLTKDSLQVKGEDSIIVLFTKVK